MADYQGYLQTAQAGFNLVSTYNSAIGKKNLLGYEAQVDAYNAAIAGYQAEMAQRVGATNEQNARLATAAQIGAQRAHLAASGVDLGEGSATDVLASTEYLGERQVLTIRDDTNRQVWALRNQQAADLRDQQFKLAQSSAINPAVEAFGSLLGSASTVSNAKWDSLFNNNDPAKKPSSNNQSPTNP